MTPPPSYPLLGNTLQVELLTQGAQAEQRDTEQASRHTTVGDRTPPPPRESC